MKGEREAWRSKRRVRKEEGRGRGGARQREEAHQEPDTKERWTEPNRKWEKEERQ